ncbi:MAG: RluA family pseudouridine synthase [Desulfopila sp.]
MMATLTGKNILYEDNHLLVVNKAAGLLTQPVPADRRDSLEEMAKGYLKVVYNKPGRVFLHSVHRIDRQVSGLVIFARTDKALSRLNAAMRDQRITKIYHALVEGHIPGPMATPHQLSHYLSHRSHFAAVSASPTEGSRLATLAYTVLDRNGRLSLVRIELGTGRYHQIRAQMAAIGHPVIGDRRYGATTLCPVHDGIALHSRNCRVPHPVRKELLDLTAPYPPFWSQLLANLSR